MEQIGGLLPAYQLLLRDVLGPRARVFAICRTCGHEKQLSLLWTLEHHGDMRLTKLEERLYCTPCRHAGRVSLVKLRIEWLADPRGRFDRVY